MQITMVCYYPEDQRLYLDVVEWCEDNAPEAKVLELDYFGATIEFKEDRESIRIELNDEKAVLFTLRFGEEVSREAESDLGRVVYNSLSREINREIQEQIISRIRMENSK